MKFNMRLKKAVLLASAMLFVFSVYSVAQQENPAESGASAVQGSGSNNGTDVSNTGSFVQEVDTTPLTVSTPNMDSSEGVTVGNIIYSDKNKDCIKAYRSGDVIIERVTRLDKKKVDCVVTEDEVPSYNQPAK